MSTLFLDQNPSEAVIFCAKKENSKDDLNKVKSILNSKIPTIFFFHPYEFQHKMKFVVRLVYQRNIIVKKKNYGILLVDFADQELAHKIYPTN